MTKNKIRKLIACCVILGIAIAGGILYFTKHRNSQKSLEKDFHDFEDEFDETEDITKQKEEKTQNQKKKTLKREYVSIPYEPSSGVQK